MSSACWIAVTDSLPDVDTLVLIFSQGASEPVWIGYFDDETNQWRTAEGSLISVSHWQPLPEPPKEYEPGRKPVSMSCLTKRGNYMSMTGSIRPADIDETHDMFLRLIELSERK